MPFDWLIFSNLVIFAFVTSITPGPNNSMLAYSGLNFGFRRTLAHIIGIEAGFNLLLFLCGFGLGTIFTTFPILIDIFKYVFWISVAWMAYHMIRARHYEEGKHLKPFSFWQAFWFQFINFKVWIMVLGALATYRMPYFLDPFSYQGLILWLSLIALVFNLAGFLCSAVWVFLGKVLSLFFHHDRHYHYFNVAMAVLLILSVFAMEFFK